MAAYISSAIDGSPLGRLPPELRNVIYELCLVQPATIHVSYHERHASSSKRHAEISTPCLQVQLQHGDNGPKKRFPCHAVALLRVCKQIHEECAKLPFSLNTFLVELRMKSVTNRYDPSPLHDPKDTPKKINGALDPLRMFLAAIGDDNTAALRDMSVSFGELFLRSECAVIGGILEQLSLIAGIHRWRLCASLEFLLMYKSLHYTVELARAARTFRAIADDLEQRAANTALSPLRAYELKRIAEHPRFWEQAARAWPSWP